MMRATHVREHERRKMSGGKTAVREHDRTISSRGTSETSLERRYRSSILVDVAPENPRRYRVELKVSDGVKTEMDIKPKVGINRNRELEQTIRNFRNRVKESHDIEPTIKWTPRARMLYTSLGGRPDGLEERLATRGSGGSVQYEGSEPMPTNISRMKEHIDRIAWEISREKGNITFDDMLAELERRHGKEQTHANIGLIADAFEEHAESGRLTQIEGDAYLHVGHLECHYVYGYD